ncbi:MAG: hypothetical protein WCK98_07225 [bacterium]
MIPLLNLFVLLLPVLALIYIYNVKRSYFEKNKVIVLGVLCALFILILIQYLGSVTGNRDIPILQLYICTLPVFALVYVYKYKKTFFQKNKIIVLSVSGLITVGVLCATLLSLSLGQIKHLWPNDYVLKEKSTTRCTNGGIIKQYSYRDLFYDELGFLQASDSNIYIYENSSKYIPLPGISSKDFAKSLTDNNNFLKGQLENSSYGDSPVLDFLQREMQFTVVNDKSYQESKTKALAKYPTLEGPNAEYKREKYGVSNLYESLPTISATYINPDKVSKTEFNDITDCAKKVSVGSVFVYGKAKGLLKTPNQLVITSIADEFSCVNDGLILVQKNGAVSSGYYKLNSRSTYQIDEEMSIGYFNLKGEFIREKIIDQNFSYYKTENVQYLGGLFKEDKENSFYIEKVGFDTSFKDSKTLKLLFNEKQEPVDDYLKSCKNDQDKNIFEAFKN